MDCGNLWMIIHININIFLTLNKKEWPNNEIIFYFFSKNSHLFSSCSFSFFFTTKISFLRILELVSIENEKKMFSFIRFLWFFFKIHFFISLCFFTNKQVKITFTCFLLFILTFIYIYIYIYMRKKKHCTTKNYF